MRTIIYKATLRIDNVEIDLAGKFDIDDDENSRVGLATEHIHSRISLPVLQVTDQPIGEEAIDGRPND